MSAIAFKRAAKVAEVVCDDGADTVVLVVVPDGLPLILRGSAKAIWHVAAGRPDNSPRDIVQIVVEVAKLSETSSLAIRDDVESCILRLVNLGVLTEVSSLYPRTM